MSEVRPFRPPIFFLIHAFSIQCAVQPVVSPSTRTRRHVHLTVENVSLGAGFRQIARSDDGFLDYACSRKDEDASGSRQEMEGYRQRKREY